MKEGILEEVRKSCAWVAWQADNVKINFEKIPAYTAFILEKYPLITEHTSDHLVTEDAEETARYIFALDSINFGSGYFAETGLEYLDIAGRLKKAFLNKALSDPSQWSFVTAELCHEIFMPPVQGDGARILMEKFAHHLKVMGQWMTKTYGGEVLQCLRQAQGSVCQLVAQVIEMPTFNDRVSYKGRQVSFLKRAQILAAHLELTKIPNFKDMHQLTCFADNMIPHVLRRDGIFSYSADLDQCIQSGIFLGSGSAEEIELRACAIHAVECMRESANTQRPQITSANLDHILWNRGYEPEIYQYLSHRTRSEWY